MFGGGGAVNMRKSQCYLLKTLKKRKNDTELGGMGGVSTLNWGVFTPPLGGCKI